MENYGARASDPWTSHAAFADAKVNASEGRMLVIECLFKFGPMTDYELADRTGWQQNSIGKRRLECMRAQWVRPSLDESGKQRSRPAPSGSQSLVWECCPPPSPQMGLF